MKPIRVLLVDDEAVTGTALEGWMKRRGFDVVYAEGPAAADEILKTQRFDVVLSDIQMPGNFKLEWIARRLGEDCPPPILLMTGSPELETAMRAANLPVAGYLLKPLFYDEAAALIERLAEDHQRRRELLDLSREVREVLAAAGEAAASDPLAQQLHRLATAFTAEARSSPRSQKSKDEAAPWREAIVDTIAVLEKTKHAFRSKDLGALRRRLEHLV